MAEPASTATPIVLATSGITLMGINTGLEPGLLFAGLAGGWWALSYSPEPMPLPRRISVGAVSALAGAWGAAWGAPIAAAWLASTFSAWWPEQAASAPLGYIAALVIGLLAHRQLGPLLMRRAGALDQRVKP